MSDFFHMGGFGAYIWSAMSVALILMLLEPITLVVKRRFAIQEIKKIKRLQERSKRKAN